MQHSNSPKVIEFLSKCGVIDVESTSPEPESCEIIELAYGKLIDDDWLTVNHRYNPGIPIPPASAEKHFITNADVRDKPDFTASLREEQFGDFINSTDYYVAHNAMYDRTSIIQNLKRRGVNIDTKFQLESNWICTFELAKKLFKNDYALPAYRLGFLWFFFELNEDCNREIIPHRADSDIYMDAKLLEYLVNAAIDFGLVDINLDIGPQIIEILNTKEKPTHWMYGKYKGELISNLPRDYLNWCINNMDVLNSSSTSYDDMLFAAVKEAMNG